MATRNPIPSEAPEDLKFNAGKIDEEVNSDAEYYVDRFGIRRFTNEGRNKLAERQRDRWDSRFQNIAAQYGWRQIPYVAGNVLELRTDYVEIPGEGGYSLNYDVPLPYTLTGDWATESVNFTRMSDATLRADLADPDIGAFLVAGSTIGLNSTQDFSSLSVDLLQKQSDGIYFNVSDYHGGWVLQNRLPIGGGLFKYDKNSTETIDNGIVFGHPSGIGRFIRILNGTVNPCMWGAGLTSLQDTEAFKKCLEFCKGNSIEMQIIELDRDYEIQSGEINFAHAGLTIRGVGKPSLKFIGGDAGFVASAGSPGAYLEGMTVENLIIKGMAGSTYGFNTSGIVRSVFRNIEVIDFGNVAFRIQFAVSCTFDSLKYSSVSHSIRADYGVELTDNGAPGFYCADNTFINLVSEDNIDGTGLLIRNGSGNTFIGGTFEGMNRGAVIFQGCARNTFIGTWLEANKNIDIDDGGEFNKFINCYMGSASELLNLQLSTSQGSSIDGGYVRSAQIQSPSKNTSFINVGFDENLSGTLGIQGELNYTTRGCLKVDSNGNVTGIMPEITGNSGKSIKNVSNERVPDQSYTNLTGSTINVSAMVIISAGSQCSLLIDGSAYAKEQNSGSSNEIRTLSGVVPAGSVYAISTVSGSISIDAWKERGI